MPARATRLLLIRHGETDWNVDTRLQGHTDIALNAFGLRQAQTLVPALADEAVAAIYSSDLQRAQQTASPLATQLGLPLQLDAGLRERGFGSFEGRTPQQWHASDPESARRWRQRDPEFAAPGGETLRAFDRRVIRAVLAIAAAHPGQTVVIVTHGGALDCVWRCATGLALHEPRTFALPNAGINRVLVSAGVMTLIGWNDTAHLDQLRDDSSC